MSYVAGCVDRHAADAAPMTGEQERAAPTEVEDPGCTSPACITVHGASPDLAFKIFSFFLLHLACVNCKVPGGSHQGMIRSYGTSSEAFAHSARDDVETNRGNREEPCPLSPIAIFFSFLAAGCMGPHAADAAAGPGVITVAAPSIAAAAAAISVCFVPTRCLCGACVVHGGSGRLCVGGTRNTESSRRAVGERRSVPESPATLAQALGFSRAEVRRCELSLLRVCGRGFVEANSYPSSTPFSSPHLPPGLAAAGWKRPPTRTPHHQHQHRQRKRGGQDVPTVVAWDGVCFGCWSRVADDDHAAVTPPPMRKN